MRKDIITRIVGILSLLVSIPVYAYDFTDNGIFYDLKNDGTLEVKGLASWTTVADIPSSITVNGTKYRVTSIGNNAFEGRSDITYLSIQYSIKSIGEYAFMDCGSNMTVNIANLEAWCKMELGNEHSSPLSSAGKVLLYDVETTSINIPETVTSIGKYTFYQCRSITSLSIAGSVTSIGSSAFEDCTGLTSVTLSKGLKSIGGSSFEGCKGLTSITIPSTVTSIALNAFKDCSSLNNITSEIQQPFAINESVFSTYATATLTVPNGTKSVYQSTAGWNQFKKIIETTSGMDDPTTQYFTFVAKENGTFSFRGTSSDKVDNSIIYYSLDEGASWTALARNVQSPTIQAGKRIMFKGTLTPFYYKVSDEETISGIGGFSSTGRFDVEGNIMSLIYGDNFIGKTNLTGKDHAFFELFLDCTGLSSAGDLVLPATTLSDNCYEGMFRNCTSLTVVPQLPATKLTISCYEGMFYNCTSLTITPQLPATSLGISCYCYMFGGCKSISKAPKLPATTLTEMCYRSMFRGCKSLTVAPELPATTLTSKCYEYMFNGCTSLKEITCLATNISASDCTSNWLSNVASTGTFTKSSSMNSWTRGANGIPTNWTIQNDNGSSTNEVTINSISYVVDNSTLTAEVKSVDNSLRSVNIPESINYNGIDYRVTSLAKKSFKGRDDLTYLFIPSSITSIGEEAFMDCGSNIEVNIESLEAWCEIAFEDKHSCPLSSAKAFKINDVEVKSLTIPNSVTSIPYFAFYQCRSITSLTIPSSVTSIGSSAFEDCTGLGSVSLSKGLISIGGSAFEGCISLPAITIPSTVTTILINAFQGCSNLNDIISMVQKPFAIKESVFSTYSTAILTVPYGTKIAYETTEGWKNFSKIVDGLEFTSDNITYVITSTSTVAVKSVSNSLKSVIIPESVSNNGTTYRVTALTEKSFEGRHDIISLSIPSSITSIGEDAFMDCGSNIEVYITSLEAWCEVKFGNQQSSPLSNAKTLFIDGKVVKDLVIPNGITSIPHYSFYQCKSITSLNIPNSVTSVGSSAFEDCVGLTSVILSRGLTKIGGSTFEGCTGLTSITIPYTVTEIGLNAFKECTKLIDIKSEIQYPFEIDGNVFSTYSTATLTVPYGSKEYYQTTAGWSNFAHIIDGTESNEFTKDGITYETKTSDTIEVKSVDISLISIEIPSSISYEGVIYTVDGISKHAFDGSRMAALIWNVDTALPNGVFDEVEIGSNFLLYVKDASYAPSSVKNVIVDGTAQSVSLSDDGGQFYCPKSFTASSISYTHNYSMETGGDGKGWETIALPFDVQRINHNQKGEIVPFASYSSSSSQKPFWLANFSGSGFRRTSAIKANEPYIIAMPNNSKYKSDYVLAGDVSFTAENVQVTKTPAFSGMFVPTFATVAKSATVHALNVNNRYVKYSGSYEAGSCFISDLRDIRPFEAYISDSSTRGIFEINFDGGATDIDRILFSVDEGQKVTIHTLSGLQVVSTTQRDFDAVWQQLPKGVYIVNGTKWIK